MKKLMPTFISIALALLSATILIFLYGNENLSLNFFTRIEGNYFKINAVLLILIITSYCIVLLNLVGYFVDNFNDVYKYQGNSKKVKWYNGLTFVLLISVVVVTVGYLIYIGSCCFLTPKKYFTLKNIIHANHYLSIFVFIVFSLTDLFVKNSQTLELNETQQRLKAVNGDTRSNIKSHISEISNNIEFAKSSLFLISIPSLVVSFSAMILHDFLEAKPVFHIFIDKSLLNDFELPLVESHIYKLFMDGLETGIIVSVIFVSQFIFVVLKTRWHYMA